MSRPRVLVVDDEPDHRAVLCELLDLEGFDPAAAPHGAAALEWLARNERPAFILVDLMMPVMNGYAFREALLRDPALAAIPTAVLTASRVPDEALARLRFCAVLRKPPDIARLVDLVRRHAVPDAAAGPGPG